MLAVTTWASLDRSVWVAAVDLWRDPWGRATLFDTYWAFLTFYCWLAYKERSWASKLGWLVGILLLGNIAMAIYMLIQVFRVSATAKIEEVLLRKA